MSDLERCFFTFFAPSFRFSKVSRGFASSKKSPSSRSGREKGVDVQCVSSIFQQFVCLRPV